MNLENIDKLCRHLENLPEGDRFDWTNYGHKSNCGTTACVAGWAYIILGGDLESASNLEIITAARKWLDLTDSQARLLFLPINTLNRYLYTKFEQDIDFISNLFSIYRQTSIMCILNNNSKNIVKLIRAYVKKWQNEVLV